MEKTSKHDYTPLEINEFHQTQAQPSRPEMARSLSASTLQATQVPATPATAVAAAAAAAAPMGYVPKQGKMTIEDVEQEISMLMERMEFLEKTLQDLKKENAKNLN